MNTRFLSRLATAGLLSAVLAASPAAAQGPVHVDVPFAFVVNDTELPPGAYEVSSRRDMLVLRGPQDTKCVLSSGAASRDGRPRLLFRRHGQAFFLRQVWLGGGFGHEIAPSRREPERSRLARGRQVSTSVEEVVIQAGS